MPCEDVKEGSCSVGNGHKLGDTRFCWALSFGSGGLVGGICRKDWRRFEYCVALSDMVVFANSEI